MIFYSLLAIGLTGVLVLICARPFLAVLNTPQWCELCSHQTEGDDICMECARNAH